MNVTWKIKTEVHKNMQRPHIEVHIFARHSTEADQLEEYIKAAIVEKSEEKKEE